MTLIFGKIGRVREVGDREPDLDPDGLPDVDGFGGRAVLADDTSRAEPHEVVPGRRVRVVPGDRRAGPAHRLEVAGHDVARGAVVDDLARS